MLGLMNLLILIDSCETEIMIGCFGSSEVNFLCFLVRMRLFFFHFLILKCLIVGFGESYRFILMNTLYGGLPD